MGKNARNAEYTKEYNRKLFLRLLHKESLSRSEIARKMGLTRATTSVIADELLQEGFILDSEAGGVHRGRTPVPLSLNPDACYAVGVYLNRNGCTVGLVDICGHLITEKHLLLSGTQKSGKLESLSSTISQIIEESKIAPAKIVGVGISAPGPLDGESGLILNPPRFDLWHNTDICSIIRERLGIPTYLENNASCLARYNMDKPEACGSEDFLLLLVDSGVGSGVISRGKLLKGLGYFTSELGHTTINFRGKKCECGNIGCLEAYAAIPNLLASTPFSKWEDVIDQFDSNPEAQKLVAAEAEYLAAGICNIANLISIDTVLLAGDLLYGIDRIAPILEENVNRHTLRRDVLPISIRAAAAGPNVKVLAAADIAFGRYLSM